MNECDFIGIGNISVKNYLDLDKILYSYKFQL